MITYLYQISSISYTTVTGLKLCTTQLWKRHYTTHKSIRSKHWNRC